MELSILPLFLHALPNPVVPDPRVLLRAMWATGLQGLEKSRIFGSVLEIGKCSRNNIQKFQMKSFRIFYHSIFVINICLYYIMYIRIYVHI